MSRQTARKSIPNSSNKPSPVYMCKECGIIFRKKADWREHTTVFHDPNDIGGRKYVCLDCGKYFPGSFQLKEHQTTHTLSELMAKIRQKEASGVLKTSVPRVGKFHAGEAATTTPHAGTAAASTVQPISVAALLKIEESEEPKAVEQESPLPPPSLPQKRLPGGSACPVCKEEFENASLMLHHTVSQHRANITKISAKVSKKEEVLANKQYTGISLCPFCMDKFKESTSCLLHIFSGHRQHLYLGVVGADKIVMTVEVGLNGETLGKPQGFIFRVNVTVNLKTTKTA